ncbi:hypothetical protein DL96DRAFT_1763989, partial [Flagelloscypha sp. PMI_526]
LNLANAIYNHALELYNEIHHRRGIAACTFSLGKVILRMQEMESAETTFSRALSLWQDIGDNWWIAETHQAIGDLHLQKMQLNDAESSLCRALDIYTTKVHSRTNEAKTRRSIGCLHILRGQFEDSRQVLQYALELDIAASNRLGQGQSYRYLGDMFLKKGDLEDAELSYTNALRLFFKIEGYQATPCLLDLGKVWVRQGKIKKSDAEDAVFLRVCCDAESQDKETGLPNASRK